jgi:hypothetical protein
MVKIQYEITNASGTDVGGRVAQEPEVRLAEGARAYVSGDEVVVEAKPEAVKDGTSKHFDLSPGESGTLQLVSPELNIRITAQE